MLHRHQVQRLNNLFLSPSSSSSSTFFFWIWFVYTREVEIGTHLCFTAMTKLLLEIYSPHHIVKFPFPPFMPLSFPYIHICSHLISKSCNKISLITIWNQVNYISIICICVGLGLLCHVCLCLFIVRVNAISNQPTGVIHCLSYCWMMMKYFILKMLKFSML